MKKRKHRNGFKNSSKQTIAAAVSRLQNVYQAGKQWQIAWCDARNSSKSVSTGSANAEVEDTDAALGRLKTLAFDRSVASATYMLEILRRHESGESSARILTDWDGDFDELTTAQIIKLRETLRSPHPSRWK